MGNVRREMIQVGGGGRVEVALTSSNEGSISLAIELDLDPDVRRDMWTNQYFSGSVPPPALFTQSLAHSLFSYTRIAAHR